MKASIIAALTLAPALLVLPPAQAKLVVGDPQPVIAISADDTAVATGPSGTLLEANYFNAPQPQRFGSRTSCRASLSLSDRSRLAPSCD
jgi:hypothetical protein